MLFLGQAGLLSLFLASWLVRLTVTESSDVNVRTYGITAKELVERENGCMAMGTCPILDDDSNKDKDKEKGNKDKGKPKGIDKDRDENKDDNKDSDNVNDKDKDKDTDKDKDKDKDKNKPDKDKDKDKDDDDKDMAKCSPEKCPEKCEPSKNHKRSFLNGLTTKSHHVLEKRFFECSSPAKLVNGLVLQSYTKDLSASPNKHEWHAFGDKEYASAVVGLCGCTAIIVASTKGIFT